MTSRAVATVGLRIFALWIILQGLFGAVIATSVAVRGLPARHSSGATVLTSDTERVHDPAQISAVLWSTLPTVGAHFGVGLVLIFFSKPLGRLVARRSE
jgi:hypothetical protein